MPPVIAWLAAHAIASFFIGIAVSVGLGFIQRALMPKPRGLGAPKPTGRELSVRQSDPYWQIVYGPDRVGAAIMPVGMAGANNEYFYFIGIWAHGGPDGIGSIDTIYFGDEVAVNGTTPIAKYTGLITVEHHLGTDAQTASTILTTDLPAVWTSAHRLRGHAYTVFKLKYDQDKFSDFSVERIRAQITGRVVLDTRTGASAYSANPVLCLRDCATNSRFGLGLSAAKMDDAANNAAANICDELVAIKAGGTEARYALACAFLTDQQRGSPLEEMRRSMAGAFIWSGGKGR